MAITEAQYDKLPKYARDEIDRLREEVRSQQSLINTIGSSQKPTKVRVERYGGRGRFVDYIDPSNGVEFILPSAEGMEMENVLLVNLISHPVLGDRLQIMATGYPTTLHVTPQSSNVVNITTARY